MPPDEHLLLLHRLLYARPARLWQLLQGETPRSLVSRIEADRTIAGEITDEMRRGVSADLDWLSQPDHHLVIRGDADYPACLGETRDPPCLLFVRGCRDALQLAPRVAIVGSRRASQYGLRQAATLAESLAKAGLVVVSGLALGIDTAAHEGALAGAGVTLAVLGTGCDQVYPRRNWRLADRIAGQGALVSELPTGIRAFPASFPRRNRIVTGLCSATVVVEAAEASGSLISARLALNEGREVMAVPGLVTNPQARGCHRLIRDGALLVETAVDILDELGLGDLAPVGIGSPVTLSASQQVLLDCLAEGPQSIDMLCARLGQQVDEMGVDLVMLEVMGLVYVDAGHYAVNPGN